MLNIAFSIGEIFPEPRPPVAPPPSQLVPPRCWLRAVRFVLLRVLVAGSRSVSLLSPPPVFSLLFVYPSLCSLGSELYYSTIHPSIPQPFSCLPPPSCPSRPAFVLVDVGPLTAVGVALGSVCVFLLTSFGESESIDERNGARILPGRGGVAAVAQPGPSGRRAGTRGTRVQPGWPGRTRWGQGSPPSGGGGGAGPGAATAGVTMDAHVAMLGLSTFQFL